MTNTKTLSQQLREFMDQVDESKTRDYDLETIISNFELAVDATDQQIEEWDDDLKVGINFKLSGEYLPQTQDDPAEHPEIDSVSVYCLKTGELLPELSDEQYDQVEDAIWKNTDSQ